MKFKLKELLDGYEDSELFGIEGPFDREKVFICRRISGSFTARAKRFNSHGIIRAVKTLSEALAYTTSRAYASLLLAFGVLSMLLHFGRGYFGGAGTDIIPIVIGAIFSVAAIPMFMLDGPLGVALQRHTLTDYIFFEFFCLKRTQREKVKAGIPLVLCTFVGIFLSVVGFFLPVKYVAVAILAAIFLYLSFVSPEFPLFAGILVLPLMPAVPYGDTVLALIAAVMLVSFIRKVFYGKRTLMLEQYDGVHLLMLLAIFISGVFLGGFDSFKSALLIVGAGLAYFVIASTVTNQRLAECMINSFILSSVPISIIATVQFIIQSAELGFSEALQAGVGATLPSAQMLCAFLITAICFTLLFIKRNTSRGVAAVYHLILVLDLAALFFTGSLIAVVAILIGLAVLPALRLRRYSGFAILILLAIPYILVAFAGFEFWGGFLSLLYGKDVSVQIELWGSTLELIGKHPIFGVGIGSESFSRAIAELDGTLAASAGNLFLGLASEGGCLAVVFFVSLIVIRLRHRAVYYRYLEDSRVGDICNMDTAVLVALLVLGTTQSLFSEPVTFYLFVCIFGLGSAVLRISRDEHDNRVRYYHDARRVDSAAVDIDLR